MLESNTNRCKDCDLQKIPIYPKLNIIESFVESVIFKLEVTFKLELV